ncbi:MAG: hypothetical protein N3E51_03300 [Candidatus Micrarchaeota archaeon]|nr:hypothetical protein [Candidatus Micrarchaeota archaeon]
MQAGPAQCNITVQDVLGQQTVSSINFTLADRKPPVPYAIYYEPNTSASLDPNVTINVSANLTEYTDVDAAILYYSSDGITYLAVPMARVSNSSDWFLYRASFTPEEEANYSIKVYANDTLGNANTSSPIKIPVFYDWTWERSPASFGSVGTTPGNNTSLMNLAIHVTGDRGLSFRVKSDYGSADGGRIYYNGTPEDTLLGSPLYNISAGQSIVIPISATARLTGGVIPITFTITAQNSSATPLSNTTTGTLVSTNESIFLFAEFVSPPTSVVQGQTGVSITSKVTNYGLDGTATGTALLWTLPSGWSTFEPLTINIGNLAPSTSYTSTLNHISIDSAAPAGSQPVSVHTTCNENSSYTAITYVNVVSTGPGPSPGPSPSPGGGGGGGGGGAPAPSTAPANITPKKVEKPLTKEQKSQLFSTLATYELVRGRDSTFDLVIANPLPSTLYNVTINVSGYLYQYLRLDPSFIPAIPAGENRTVKIYIEAPKYFSEGTFTLYFDISGFSVTQDESTITTTNIKERRTVELKILEMTRQQAYDLISEAYKIKKQLEEAGVFTGQVVNLFEDSISAYSSDKFATLSSNLQKMKSIRNAAIVAKERLALLKEKIDMAESEDIRVPQSTRLYSLAAAAFERGDYESAMMRISEAELTYALETNQGFSLSAFLKRYWVQISTGFVILIAISFIVFVDVRFWMIDNELSQLTNEENIVLGLIKEVQNDYFEKGKLSTSEYTSSVQQYDSRLSKIIERKVELETLKKNYFNLKSKAARRLDEKARLEELIKQLQKDYLEEGKMDTRVYENRMRSYLARLSEVEEQIAVSEAEERIKKETSWLDVFKKAPPEAGA